MGIEMNNTDNKQIFVREVCARYSGPRRKGVQIQKPADMKPFLSGILKDNAREQFFAVYLDGAHRIVSYSVVSIGTAQSTLVHPREVFQPAILAGACAVIIAHNHPSGELTPSDKDREVTNSLVQAGGLLGIPILDHIIFAGCELVSAADQGWLP
jgi:DNA repair protein RadC